MANNYEVNYDDKRLTDIKAEEKTVLDQAQANYDDTVADTDKYYKDAIDGVNKYETDQTKIANAALEQNLKEIEQQKTDAKKDYIKEQSGAYVDWQRQSNKYGTVAEEQASIGMTGTGYSESSQVSMYNTYQNRIATAREGFNRIVTDYDNQMNQAKIQNSSLLAKIAYDAMADRTELLLAQTQYKNQLLQDLTDQKLAISQSYAERYQSVVDAIAEAAAEAEKEHQALLDEMNGGTESDDTAIDKDKDNGGSGTGNKGPLKVTDSFLPKSFNALENQKSGERSLDNLAGLSAFAPNSFSLDEKVVAALEEQEKKRAKDIQAQRALERTKKRAIAGS